MELSDYQKYVFNNRISGKYHPTRESISELLYHVQHNYALVESMVNEFFSHMNGEHGDLDKSKLTNLHYTMVNDCYYFCDYLLANNVDPEIVYNSSDYLINQVSSVRTGAQMMAFMKMMSEIFFGLMKQRRTEKYSYHVEKAIRYISQQLYSGVTLNSTASFLGLTPQYLTTLFHHETGKTVYQYIKEKKMQEACNILAYTNESITSIGSSMGYSTTTAFSAAFRREFGETPVEYRRKAKEDLH